MITGGLGLLFSQVLRSPCPRNRSSVDETARSAEVRNIRIFCGSRVFHNRSSPVTIGSPLFQKIRAGLLGVVGGEDNFEKVLSHAVAPDWVQAFNGPHRELGVLKTFDYQFEASRHGDEHQLWADWDNSYGKNQNFVMPFLRMGWEEKFGVAAWVMCTHPEDHYKISTEHVQKAPVYDGGSYGRNFLAHIDEKEWKRRRFSGIHAVAPMHIRGYFHKMERHCQNLVDRIASGQEGTMMYGAGLPEPAMNIHEMVADIAFKIACDCLFGLDDDFVEARSRKVAR